MPRTRLNISLTQSRTNPAIEALFTIPGVSGESRANPFTEYIDYFVRIDVGTTTMPVIAALEQFDADASVFASFQYSEDEFSQMTAAIVGPTLAFACEELAARKLHDLAGGCPACGSGAPQVGPLVLEPLSESRTDRTLGMAEATHGYFLAHSDLIKGIGGVQNLGAATRDVEGPKRLASVWKQIEFDRVVRGLLPRCSHYHFDVDYACPRCRRTAHGIRPDRSPPVIRIVKNELRAMLGTLPHDRDLWSARTWEIPVSCKMLPDHSPRIAQGLAIFSREVLIRLAPYVRDELIIPVYAV